MDGWEHLLLSLRGSAAPSDQPRTAPTGVNVKGGVNQREPGSGLVPVLPCFAVLSARRGTACWHWLAILASGSCSSSLHTTAPLGTGHLQRMSTEWQGGTSQPGLLSSLQAQQSRASAQPPAPRVSRGGGVPDVLSYTCASVFLLQGPFLPSSSWFSD